jgi:mRNA interferase MazF
MKQSEVWLINLAPTTGAEIKKTRPAIIVNDDALGKLPLKVIVPVTDWKSKYEIFKEIKLGLSKVLSIDNE